MRSLLFALLVVMSAPHSALLAQESSDAAQCPAIIFESKIDRKTIVENSTQLIESGKLTGGALARAHLTRMPASWAVGTRDHSQTSQKPP
jgi:hypothetical protein